MNLKNYNNNNIMFTAGMCAHRCDLLYISTYSRLLTLSTSLGFQGNDCPLTCLEVNPFLKEVVCMDEWILSLLPFMR